MIIVSARSGWNRNRLQQLVFWKKKMALHIKNFSQKKFIQNKFASPRAV